MQLKQDTFVVQVTQGDTQVRQVPADKYLPEAQLIQFVEVVLHVAQVVEHARQVLVVVSK